MKYQNGGGRFKGRQEIQVGGGKQGRLNCYPYVKTIVKSILGHARTTYNHDGRRTTTNKQTDIHSLIWVAGKQYCLTYDAHKNK